MIFHHRNKNINPNHKSYDQMTLLLAKENKILKLHIDWFGKPIHDLAIRFNIPKVQKEPQKPMKCAATLNHKLVVSTCSFLV